jgi:hypothetical protein
VLKRFFNKFKFLQKVFVSRWYEGISGNRGGISIVYLGMLTIVIMMIFLTTIMDFCIYVQKRSFIKKSIDLAVCGAVQEINIPESTGLQKEFIEGGKVNLIDIVIDDEKALKVYYNMIKATLNIQKNKLENNTLCIVVNPKENNLHYVMYKGINRSEGYVSNPFELEALINNNFDFVSDSVDSQKIYINGNKKTNEFAKNPYFMVFIKDLEIDGLFKKRSATLISFQAARLIRQ